MNELDHLQRGLIATWQLWMQWFVWFYGAQVVLLWARPSVFEKYIVLVASLWIAFSASGAAMAILVAHYTWVIGERYPGLGFPTRYAAIGALLNAVPLLASCVVWRKVGKQKTPVDSRGLCL